MKQWILAVERVFLLLSLLFSYWLLYWMSVMNIPCMTRSISVQGPRCRMTPDPPLRRQKVTPVSGYSWFNHLRRTTPNCSPVLTSATRKSRTKSPSSPGHIPSLNTTMVWRYIRAADSNWVGSWKLTLFLAFTAKWHISSFPSWQSGRSGRQGYFIYDWRSRENAKSTVLT